MLKVLSSCIIYSIPFLIQKLYYSSLQFFHDIKFLGEDMKAFLSVLSSQEMRAPVQTREPEVMIRHIRVSIVIVHSSKS